LAIIQIEARNCHLQRSKAKLIHILVRQGDCHSLNLVDSIIILKGYITFYFFLNVKMIINLRQVIGQVLNIRASIQIAGWPKFGATTVLCEFDFASIILLLINNFIFSRNL
jgi:hypothetical protein